MATYSDDFNRADSSSLGANWTDVTALGGWTIASNQVRVTTNATRVAVWSTACSSTDNWSQVDVTSQLSTSAGHVAACARYSNSADTGYLLKLVYNGNLQLFKVVAGSETALGSAYSSGSNVGTIKLEVNGSALSGYLNGVLRCTATDTGISSGSYVGVREYNQPASAATADDWSGGDLSSSDVTGTGDVTLPTATAAGTGTVTPPPITGTGATALPALTAAGAGTVTPPPISGTGAATLPILTATGSGAVVNPGVAGTGAVTLPTVTAAGSGAVTAPAFTGTGAATMPQLVAAGTGTVLPPPITGTGAVALPLPVVAGVWVATYGGTAGRLAPSGATAGRLAPSAATAGRLP